MNVIKEFTSVVYVGREGGVKNPEPATIYIDTLGKRASWLCPCGCGEQMEPEYRLCRPEDLSCPTNSCTVNMSINDVGEVSMSHAFHSTRCPNSLLYRIKNNRVEVLSYHEDVYPD